jgi:hypothetical protein
LHARDIQDRDGGAALMTATLLGAFPFLTGFVPTAATAARAHSDKFWRG